jgi:hypothetical protein
MRREPAPHVDEELIRETRRCSLEQMIGDEERDRSVEAIDVDSILFGRCCRLERGEVADGVANDTAEDRITSWQPHEAERCAIGRARTRESFGFAQVVAGLIDEWLARPGKHALFGAEDRSRRRTCSSHDHDHNAESSGRASRHGVNLKRGPSCFRLPRSSASI